MPGSTAIAITGLGMVTPAGIDGPATAERVWSGRPTARRAAELAGLPVDFSCRVTGPIPEPPAGFRWRTGRCSRLGVAAAREAIADAGLDPAAWDGDRVAVTVGTAFGDLAEFESAHAGFTGAGSTVSTLLTVLAPVNMTAAYIAMACRAGGPNDVISTACASGVSAVGRARDLLRAGACDLVLAGGCEAALTPTVMASLARKGALSTRRDDPAGASRPFDARRDGLVAGEGAAIMVLERAVDARARGARIRALLSGFGASADAFHPARPDPSGAGAERAVRAALRDAAIGSADVGHVNAHGTSTRLNDSIEARMIGRVFPAGPAVCSTKGVTGHLIGAAGAAEIAFTVMALERGEVPPTANLSEIDPDVEIDVVSGRARRTALDAAVSESFGFGGHNAAVVLTRA